MIAIIALLVGATSVNPADAELVGLWQFNGDLTNALPSKAPMVVAGAWTPDFVDETIGGSPAKALSFPALYDLDALDMPNQAGVNGPGGSPSKNSWSIVMDVKFPVLSNYTGLWQVQPLEGDTDGDYFIKKDVGIGISGQYAGPFPADTWTRLAVTVDGSVTGAPYTVNGYLDGTLVSTATTDSSPGGKEAVASVLHLFADEDGETSAGFVNSVAYYGEVLSESAVGTLGGASAAGIPSAVNQAGLWQFNNNLNNDLPAKAAMSVLGGWTPDFVDETIGGSPATVLAFPAMSSTQALDMPNQSTPDDFGVPTTTNIWSIVMDVKFPVVANYTSLWNVQPLSLDNPTDGDYFVRAGEEGIGIGDYAGVFPADTWTRLAVTVDGSVGDSAYTLKGYIDGVLVSTVTVGTAPNGREALTNFLHLFNDGDDGEAADGIVNSIAFYDEVLSAAAIAALGGATADGIPSVIPGVPGDYNSNGTVDAADYVVWRNGGSPDSTQAGYNLWKANFGKSTAGSGSALSAVPEPSTLMFAFVAIGIFFQSRRKSSR